MSDLIDREALLRQIDIDSEGEPGYYGDTWKFIDTIKRMPSAQPTFDARDTQYNLPIGTDCISRQAAINAVGYYSLHSGDKLLFADKPLKELPSAEPKIIYCKDCKHFVREDVEEYTPYGYNTHFYAFCDKHWDGEQGEYIDVNLDDFCSFAERREDG